MHRNIIFFITGAGLVILLWVCLSFQSDDLPKIADKPSTVISAESIQERFAEVAEKSIPAVVVVTTGRNVMVINNPRINYYGDVYSGNIERRRMPTGQGSGFFVSEDGYILTNNHIVQGQNYFRIILHDGTEYEAKLTGTDPASDLALLKIKSDKKFPYLEFADTKKVKAGHSALAIGAPFNLPHTVTAGIVSHKKRSVGLNIHENYIQTDASINPGNSGGPLLDLNGKVIGVNDFILSPSRGSIGLSFAISASLAKRILADLLKYGKVERPWLGLTMRQINQTTQTAGTKSAVVVINIFENSPAHLAGVNPGDIIFSINDKIIRKTHDVQNMLLGKRPEEKLKLQLERNGKKIVLTVKIKKAPDNFFRRQYKNYY